MFALLNVLLLLGVVLAQEPKGHEYYSNLRHIQKSEKYVAPPQQHDHEYYSNLKHLNHENGGGQVTKDHAYYSNLHHLNHDEDVRQNRHEYYANLHHINHGHPEDTSPQQEKNEMGDVHHPHHDHEYYAHLHHLQHENEPEMHEGKGHEYYSHLHHLQHENEPETHEVKGHEYYSHLHHLQHENEPETHEGKGHEYYSHLHHLSRSEKQQKDYSYYANLHHLHHGSEKYVHGERDHEYYSHMHHLHRGHHHLHGCKDDYHHHGHRSHAFFWMMMPYRMLCSPDECVPASVKNSIMQSWTETGRQIYQECNPDGQCNQQGMGKIIKCMYRTLMINRTDITVQEYRATIRSWSVRSMADSCENEITLKMMRCSRPQLHHLHRHHDESHERYHHHHRCHKHAMRPETSTPQEELKPQVPSQEKPSERIASPPPAEDDVPEPEEEQEEPVHTSHHNARHHFQHTRDNTV